MLAQIACDGSALPQGSPCSPVISNLVANVLDMRIVRLAATVGCRYSRYADDLTFSTNQKSFPREIAVPSEDDQHAWLLGNDLHRIIIQFNFKVNSRKTRMQHRDSRQEVTGLVVNRKINIRQEYRHNVRAMVHRLCSTGSFQVYEHITKGVTTLEKRDGSLDELQGRLGFIDSIDQYNNTVVNEEESKNRLSTKRLTYRKFFNYRDFYTATTPVILCEGKSDNVGIKHAILHFAADFPDLAEFDKDGTPHLKVCVYRYSHSSRGRILGLKDGGCGPITRFIGNYKKDTDKFGTPGLQNPLIILFDDDSGADVICEASKLARPGKNPIQRTE